MMGKHIEDKFEDEDKIFQHEVEPDNDTEREGTNSFKENTNEEVAIIIDKKDCFLTRVEESKEVENWRDLAIDNECLKREPLSYLAPKKEYSVCDLKKTSSVENIENLKNGNLFQLKPLLVVGERIILLNTWSFHSLTQLYCTAF
jgi:hypothetical protein